MRNLPVRKVLAPLAAAAAVAAVIAVPGAAHAETCVSVPVGSSGFTLEAGGESVRIPAIASAAVCYQIPGTTGIPWVKTEYGGASVVITGGSGAGGHVMFRYVADGSTRSVGTPIPSAGGGGSETCLVGVGSPRARPDCAVKLHADQLVPSPLPTAPPVPTTGPLPTLPPRPTPPPVPTVPPVATPEVDPYPACIRPNVCLPQGGTYWDGIREFMISIGDRVNDILDDPCKLDPKC